jgi:hypothetical protein
MSDFNTVACHESFALEWQARSGVLTRALTGRMYFVPSQSLRDKSHSAIEGPRIQLALMGFQPQEPSTPSLRPHKALLRCALGKNTRRARVGGAEGASENSAQSGPFRSSRPKRCSCIDARAIEIGQLRSFVPFSANRPCTLSGCDAGRPGSPGLKPRAESSSPFGANYYISRSDVVRRD